ncbi:hypothetical protein HY839_03315 [Candidatus Azambacteria bacterium]|nr:hypothetical protein [Candidatus Azambacteria bacterium]
MEKSHAAGWTQDSPTSAQLKELFAQIENGRITKRKLQDFLRTGIAPGTRDTARQILGDDIIFPDEIAKARHGLSYTDTSFRDFEKTVPSEETLRWCKTNNCAIVAGPPIPMGLLKIRSLNPALFSTTMGNWYEKYLFSHNDEVKSQWIIISKEAQAKGYAWHAQSNLPEGLYIPHAGEMSWFITTFFEVRNIRLFEKIYVRTSSESKSWCDHVCISGVEKKAGINISRGYEDRGNPYIGVAIGLRLPVASLGTVGANS